MDIMCTLIAVSHSSSWISLMYIVTCHDHSSATSSESRNAHSLGFYSLWPNSLVPTVFPHRSYKWKLLQLKWVIPGWECSRLDYIFITGSPARETAHKVQHVLVEERRGCTVAFVFPRIYTYTSFLLVAVMVIRKICKNISLRGSVHISTNKTLVVTRPNDNWCSRLRQFNDNVMGRHYWCILTLVWTANPKGNSL